MKHDWRCPKCGGSKRQHPQWCAEDAAFNRMVSAITKAWDEGISCGDVIQSCPDLTRMAVERERR